MFQIISILSFIVVLGGIALQSSPYIPMGSGLRHKSHLERVVQGPGIFENQHSCLDY